MPIWLYLSIKITFGVSVSIWIATSLGLDYALSAGVITLLSILDIKRKSLLLALQRFYTAIISMTIASLLFTVFHFSIFSFGLFLFIYIPIVLKLDARSGLVVNTVLVTHIFALERIDFHIILNELLLLLIGILIALIFNLHVPNSERSIKNLQQKLEDQLKGVLRLMASSLSNYCEINGTYATLAELKSTINDGMMQAEDLHNSYYMKNNHYYMDYFKMRKNQYRRLEYMQEHCNRVFLTLDEAKPLSDFTERLAKQIHEYNTGMTLLEELEGLRLSYQASDLPKTREEFENRAILFQFLNDLEEVIKIKMEFMVEQVSQ